MEKLRQEQIEGKLKEIMELSYPLCQSSTIDIASNSSKINNLAFEILKIIKYEPKT